MLANDSSPQFKLNDVVVVSAADPEKRAKGIVKSDGPVIRDDGPNYFIHWDDGFRQWWRADRLELFKPK